MSDSHKVRVKHLTEENTREAIEGEMIISQVSGHISVKDLYFVNSSTKDIAARNSALNNFYDYVATDINQLNKEVINFNKSVNRLNNCDIKRETDLNLADTKEKVESIYHDASNLEKKIIDYIEIYTEIEKTVKQIELTCRRFQNMYQYILQQRHIFHENNDTMEYDYNMNIDVYKKNIIEFRIEMLKKYIALAEEYPKALIEFEGTDVLKLKDYLSDLNL